MAGKKHAVARRSEPRAEVTVLPRKIIARLDAAEQRYELSVEERAADVARIDEKLDQLREALVGGHGVSDEREKSFLRRLESMRKYGAGFIFFG